MALTFGFCFLGFFMSLLFYVEQNITSRLVNKPEHNMHKGSAFHLDMFVVGILASGCAMFGLPVNSSPTLLVPLLIHLNLNLIFVLSFWSS
jgi:hypothetical protein